VNARLQRVPSWRGQVGVAVVQKGAGGVGMAAAGGEGG